MNPSRVPMIILSVLTFLAESFSGLEFHGDYTCLRLSQIWLIEPYVHISILVLGLLMLSTHHMFFIIKDRIIQLEKEETRDKYFAPVEYKVFESRQIFTLYFPSVLWRFSSSASANPPISDSSLIIIQEYNPHVYVNL